MPSLVHEKVAQAIDILKEMNTDVWLTFVRETSAAGDPVIPLIYGPVGLTWPSALILARSGERIAIVGRYDADTAMRTDAYSEVIPYDESVAIPLRDSLARLNPRHVAINYSRTDVLADGLTHGMYQLLAGYLEETAFAGRLISAEKIIGALRGRKTPGEVERIRAAIKTTEEIFDRTFDALQAGLSEIEISEFMHHQMEQQGVEPAWDAGDCPVVDAGPDSPVGHATPTELKLAPGQILHLDFGVRQDDYCSDIQRVAYLLAPGEENAPEPVLRGFETVRRALLAAFTAMRPGALGKDVDQAARDVITEAGYPEYLYATGHHLGRLAHDGGGVLGPEWERYGDGPRQPITAGNVFTLEPGLMVPGYGYIGLEEDVLVNEGGAVFLSRPQAELIVKRLPE